MPCSTARSATFNHTLRHVTFYTTLRHTSQPHVCARLVTAAHLTSAHRFCSPSLTDSAQLRSPIPLNSAHRVCSPPRTEHSRFHQPRTLTLPPTTNTHASTNERSRFNQRTHASTNEHSRPLNEYSSLPTQVPHVVSTTFCHSL